MKVLLVNGSPHRVGNTYLALRKAADALEEQGIETEFFWIGAKPIGGCMACGGCAATHRCVMEDAVNACAARAAHPYPGPVLEAIYQDIGRLEELEDVNDLFSRL